MNGDQRESQSPPGGPSPAATFYLQLTLGGLLLAALVLANGLPTWLGLPRLGLVVATATIVPPPTFVPAQATARPVRIVVETPTAQAVPTATPSPLPRAGAYVVGNTGGDGVWLRKSPRLDDRLVTLLDGTALEIAGADVSAGGLTWKSVREPRGNVGFVPAEYVVPAP